MRRLNLFLLAGLQLCGARQPRFSINDDLLAYPQFEVVFSDNYISESDSLALLQSAGAPSSTEAARVSPQTELTNSFRRSPTTGYSSGNDDDDEDLQISETYELINVPPTRYLCAIPLLAPPPAPNETATELAKAEEARELVRASAKGWELMSALEGQCLYFTSGWWSYSFCYGSEIVQYHALPARGQSGPPTKDPASLEFVLGKVQHENRQDHRPSWPDSGRQQPIQQQAQQEQNPDPAPAPPKAELQIKDNQRYLVQRLDGGTICDLTGRERTIEVQYHCAPHFKFDRISSIKELTTCTYLMVVHTPRLCNDVAFLPPKDVRAYPISCRTVVGTEEEVERLHSLKAIGATEEIIADVPTALQKPVQKESKRHMRDGGKIQQAAGINIGGVVVGARQVLGAGNDGQEAVQLPKPRRLSPLSQAGEKMVQVLAQAASMADGGDLEALTSEELQEMDLNPEAIDALRKELQELAGDKGWRLEVVEVPGEQPEIRGSVEDTVDAGGSGDDDDGEQKDRDEGGSKETLRKDEL